MQIDVELLKAADTHLAPLLAAVQEAVRKRCRVTVVAPWSFNPFIPLLASHLHLRWPGRIEGLPLSPSIAVLPFGGTDFDLIETPVYLAEDARLVRQEARRERYVSGPQQYRDLIQDWEQLIAKTRSKIGGLQLPAASFLSIDRVTAGGDLKKGHRRIIGKHAPRKLPKPSILVPGELSLTKGALNRLASVDLVIINSQKARGRRTRESIAFALATIPPSTPVLLITSSPTDLVEFGPELFGSGSQVVVLGGTIASQSVVVVPVGADRAQAEREFEFAVGGLEERSQTLSHLVHMARNVWWSARQSLSSAASPSVERELKHFRTTWESLSRERPDDQLRLLADCDRLLQREAHNSDLSQQRFEALAEAVLSSPGARGVLILVRNKAVAHEALAALAQRLSVTPDDLENLGVQITTTHAPWNKDGFSTCVTAGYFGTATIDAVMASRARRLYWVVDPVEARIASRDLTHMCEVLSSKELSVYRVSLEQIASALDPTAAAYSDAVTLGSLSYGSWATKGAGAGLHGGIGYVSPGHVLVQFTDGSLMEVHQNSRFEVLGRSRHQLRIVGAADLRPGDQVVLMEELSRSAFSETLLQAADAGKLKRQADVRHNWITLLNAVCDAKRMKAGDIRTAMKTNGVEVELATIRTWLRSAADPDNKVPDNETHFLALAQALAITIPSDTLRDWFRDIQALRVGHRRLGRDLARAIRGAYLGRLDPRTLSRIEIDWGLKAKELLKAARIGVVDEVMQETPREGHAA